MDDRGVVLRPRPGGSLGDQIDAGATAVQQALDVDRVMIGHPDGHRPTEQGTSRGLRVPADALSGVGTGRG